MNFTFMSYRVKISALKNQSDIIFANYFEVCIKSVEKLEFFKFFFILNYVFKMFDINLRAAFAAGFAFACTVIFAAEYCRQKPFF